MKKKPTKNQLWVVKVGSALFIEGGPLLVRAWMHQVKTLKQKYGITVIWVTSGAIASARGRVRKRWSQLSEKQALSAIGQPMLMEQYNIGLQSLGMLGAQVLLSYDDIRQKSRKSNLKNTLNHLLKWGIVPILNENDAVATEEIQFGDNDTLSAMVAGLMDADRLVIMTNVDGFYQNGLPKKAPNEPVRHLPQVTTQMLKSISPSAISKVGTGGMLSKMKAAHHAQKYGIETWLIHGGSPEGLLRIADGNVIGTRIGGRRQ